VEVTLASGSSFDTVKTSGVAVAELEFLDEATQDRRRSTQRAIDRSDPAPLAEADSTEMA
jgi:hypothetical protein